MRMSETVEFKWKEHNKEYEKGIMPHINYCLTPNKTHKISFYDELMLHGKLLYEKQSLGNSTRYDELYLYKGIKYIVTETDGNGGFERIIVA